MRKRVYNEMGRNVLSLTVLLLGISFGFVIALTSLTYLLEMEKLEYQIFLQRPHVRQPAITEDMVQDIINNKTYNNVRVLCWVMTNPSNHWMKAQFSKRTWGKHCNILLFMSTEADPVLGTIALPVEEGRDHLWYKVRAAFRHIHKHYINDADFFMKADDDSFVIAENLRMQLSKHSPNDPNWFGCRFHLPGQHNLGYMSGAGYVLSREALRRFVEIALPNKDICFPDDIENEDIEVGRCMQNVNVTAVDTRDSHLKGTFMPFNPEAHLRPMSDYLDYWYWVYRYYGSANDTGDNCSTAAVAFHYVPPNEMVTMNYFIYNLSTYGIKDTFLPILPRNITAD